MLPPTPHAYSVNEPQLNLAFTNPSIMDQANRGVADFNDLKFSRSIIDPTSNNSNLGVPTQQTASYTFSSPGVVLSPAQQQTQQPINFANIPNGESYSNQSMNQQYQIQQQQNQVLLNTTQHLSTDQNHQQSQSLTPSPMSASHSNVTPYQSNSQKLVATAPVSPTINTMAEGGRPPRNKNKFKRFRNAFIYFVNDQRGKVDEETKKLKNREFLQLMSARWKSMDEKARTPYVKLAEEDKKRFNADVKKYGKYESRKRRYNKPRTLDITAAGFTMTHHNYNLANTGLSNSAAGIFYGGYDQMANGQGNTATSVTATGSMQPFYTGLASNPSAAAAAAASWSAASRRSSMVNPASASMQSPNGLLGPPTSGIDNRSSVSSNASSNDLSDLHSASFDNNAYGAPWSAKATVESSQPELSAQNSYYQPYGQQPSGSVYQQDPGFNTQGTFAQSQRLSQQQSQAGNNQLTSRVM